MELAEVDDQRGADHREQRGEVAVQDVDHRQLHVRVTLLEESQKPASQSITKHIYSQRVRPRRRNFADLSNEREKSRSPSAARENVLARAFRCSRADERRLGRRGREDKDSPFKALFALPALDFLLHLCQVAAHLDDLLVREDDAVIRFAFDELDPFLVETRTEVLERLLKQARDEVERGTGIEAMLARRIGKDAAAPSGKVVLFEDCREQSRVSLPAPSPAHCDALDAAIREGRAYPSRQTQPARAWLPMRFRRCLRRR
jgi:hypothetical protein